MKKVKLKARAKINITLDILGVEQNYHMLSTLVSTIDLHDTITITKRKDKLINLKMKGIKVDAPITENNAYKACKMFMQKFDTAGVNITINKNIPIAGGLGGSSADIAGVLNGMKTLFEVEDSVLPLANALGSDSGYLLTGGYAVLHGRGEKIERQDLDRKLYLLIITEDKQISAKLGYATFDAQGKTYAPCTDMALKALKEGDKETFAKVIKNDLYPASCQILPEITQNLASLKKVNADAFVMTGSGSAVYGVFFDKKARNRAYKNLLPLYKGHLLKAETE
jgi:4-diphosphocytidyl-2-C-methyl-D-erythritol kinase